MAAAEVSAGKLDDFKFTLFPQQQDSQEGIARYVDQNIINFDLGTTSSSKQQVKQVIKDLGDLDLKAGAQANTGDDLLDLMDSL